MAWHACHACHAWPTPLNNHLNNHARCQLACTGRRSLFKDDSRATSPTRDSDFQVSDGLLGTDTKYNLFGSEETPVPMRSLLGNWIPVNVGPLAAQGDGVVARAGSTSALFYAE